jgi:hypothetical protein
MKIRIRDGLPHVALVIAYRNRQIELPNVLVDTGSAGTVFSADRMLDIGLHYEANDTVHRIRGVGGAEFVFSKQVDCLFMGELQATNFQVEVGALDYGFDLDGIIGMDFLMQAGAVLNLAKLEIGQESD